MQVGDKSPLRSTQESAAQARLEAATADLVKFAEGKPSLTEMQVKQRELQSGVLAPVISEILDGIAPAFEGTPSVKQRENLIQAEKLLGAMRSDLAGGKDFEMARMKMGVGTGQIGGLLASGCDSPLKVNVAWAMMRMSVLVSEAASPRMQNGQ